MARQTGLSPGDYYLDQSTGDRYEWDGNSWVQTGTAGAAHVTNGSAAQSDGPTTVAAAGNTTLATIDVTGRDRLSVEIAVATQALDAFLIQGRTHASASYQTLYSSANDFNNPIGLLVGTSGDLTSIAAAATGWFVLDARGLESIKLLGSAASDSASVTIRSTVS